MAEMTRAFLLALPALLLSAPAASAPAKSDYPKPDLELSASFLPPRFVVGDSAEGARLEHYLRGARRDSSEWFRLKRRSLTLSPGFLLRLAAEEDGGIGDDREAARRKRARARLERAAGVRLQEDRVTGFPADYIPNDYGLATITPQWGLRNDGAYGSGTAGMDVNVTKVWERLDGSDTLVIAVIDAGYNFNHPDLQDTWYVNPGESGMTQPGDACWTGTPRDKATNGCDDDGNGFVDDWRGWDFVDDDNDPHDFHNHGTQTGGIIAARFDNALGIAGMLPRVKILPVRVLGTAGYGYTSDIAAGVRYAAKMKAHVANFSIGINSTTLDTALQSAFVAARDSGMIIAAATGNSGIDLDANPRQPFSYGLSNVYGIAAHVPNGALAGFSNFGATQADLAAPGVDIATTTLPPAITLYSENFEAFNAAKWSISTTSPPPNTPTWAVATDSMEGTKAFKWMTGHSATATLLDTLNMRGKRGGALRFRLHFSPAATDQDVLIFEYQAKGAAPWVSFGSVWSPVAGQTLAFALGPMDDTLYRVRFRTCRVSGNFCVTNLSVANRVVRIDDLRFTYADENPANQAAYESYGGGTSLAAPYFAGYAGLMRLAADRKGVPLTRALVLNGTSAVPALAGKVATGGRLDAAKGLDFYVQGLPRVQVNDSLVTEWNQGGLVTYYFRAVDSSGVSIPDFVFTAVDAPSGSLFEPEGDFSWNTAGKPLGTYLVRVKGEHGPHVLRKTLTFTLDTVVPVLPDGSSRLWIGGRAFILPASAFTGRRALRVEFYGADGRTLRTMEGELMLPPGGQGREYRLRGFPAPGLRVWLDGKALRASKGN